MSDIVDDANETASVFIATALKNRKPATATAAPRGRCFYCNAKVKNLRRWCDADCRDGWEKERAE